MPGVSAPFAAFMTAFYSRGVMFMTFHGEPRADDETMHHAHESPWVMLVPLIVLAIGADLLRLSRLRFFVGDEQRGVLEERDPGAAAATIRSAGAEDIPLARSLSAADRCGLAGIAIAYVFYIVDPRLPVRLAAAVPRALSVPAEQMVFRRAL